MANSFDSLYDHLEEWAEAHGIAVRQSKLDPETPGEFDGLTVTINRDFGPKERAFYLAHSIGSIVRWALHAAGCRVLFDELDAAKANRDDTASLDRALERYRGFETVASEYAVWLLAELGRADVIPDYTNFWRADLEAMTIHHRTGT